MIPRFSAPALLRFALACGALAPLAASAAPPTAQHLPIQGVARDANEWLVPSGNLAVRVYAAALGGSPVYDSGTAFNGAIAQGTFDVIVGETTTLMLDSEAQYFLELDVAGAEVIGDAAGGRWPFFPGGGSHARTDLEDRLTAIEAAVGLAPSSPGALASRGGDAPLAANYARQHAMLAPALVAGSAAGLSARSNLLLQPVGTYVAGGVRAELGPYYLFVPGPSPLIRTIRDVPNDQGRAVRVRWRKDLRERPYVVNDTQPRIMSYTLYRRVDPGQAPLSIASLAPEEALALPPGEWDVLTTIPATLDSAYQTVVPTLCDSNAVGLCFSGFVVRSITDQPGTFHDSPEDSGYSADNLAPGVPQGLLAQIVPGGAQLSWLPSGAQDFQYFRVYRDPDPDFVPGPGNLVHATATTQWTDLSPGSFTYKLTAVDLNGNESAPAIASVVTGVSGAYAPRALAFASLAPNPFRRALTCVIEVPEGCGAIDLALFDLAGRRVRTLASGALAAGRHAFAWNGIGQGGERVGPGIYVARLVGAGRTITRRATLLP